MKSPTVQGMLQSFQQESNLDQQLQGDLKMSVTVGI